MIATPRIIRQRNTGLKRDIAGECWVLGSAAPSRREALGIAAMGGAICTVETELGSQTCPDINVKGHMSKAAADGIC